jgi:hypothetical protein
LLNLIRIAPDQRLPFLTSASSNNARVGASAPRSVGEL